MKIGELDVSKIYLGGSEISKIMLGTSQVYDGGDTPTPPTPTPYDEQYLTIESTSDNNTISLVAANTAITRTISASTDNGSTWTSYTSSTGGTQIASLNTGDKLLLKGVNSTYASSLFTQKYNYFTSSGQFNAYGNIMSLISGDSFVNADTLTATYTFSGLFSGCTYLTSAENIVLPATTLTNRCYSNMFQNCTSLTVAPELPATTLTKSCYYYMFSACYSLNYIKCLATDISATDCTTGWVAGVASSGTFVKAASMSSWTTGDDGIPDGWTVENDDGSLVDLSEPDPIGGDEAD